MFGMQLQSNLDQTVTCPVGSTIFICRELAVEYMTLDRAQKDKLDGGTV